MHSTKRAKTVSWRRLSWCFALAFSLLISQFFGLQHRIDHARWLAASGQQLASEASPARSSPYIDATHSCIALDAASLADGIASTLSLFAAPLPNAIHIVLLPKHQWDALFLAHFHSRAPPSPL